MKTRLARGIGPVAAAWWYRHNLARLLRHVADPRWQLVLAVSPDHAGMVSRVWPAQITRVPQGGGSLGARMARLFRGLPAGQVCLIGSDIPDVRAHYIAKAFAALGSHDAVFGPSEDGGYWLVGLKRLQVLPSRAFSKVRWSSEHALADTKHSFGRVRIADVDRLQDVDTVDDL